MAATRSLHSVGFFSDLNQLSSADFFVQARTTKRKKTIENGRLFAVERVIARRRAKDHDVQQHVTENEYLIKWANYSPFESSWEPQSHLNESCIKYFENPKPDKGIILNEVCQLRVAVAQALKAARVRQRLTIQFRQDVFVCLFGGKGFLQGQWRVLERDDFSKEFFYQPSEWDILLDLHGQGTRVHYPVKLRHFISWSPKGFLKNESGIIVEAPRAYQEKLSVELVKVAA